MGEGGSASGGATPAGRPKPLAASLIAFLQSERAAWAAQNAVGMLFAALFAVVLRLQFTLACLCGVLASSLVLSLDRSVGGRLFGGIIFVGTVLTGAGVGGGLVVLAWLAHGSGQALVEYLPEEMQAIPPTATIQRLEDAFDQFTAIPLPPLLKELVDAAVEKLSELLGEVLPPISAAYWALLMVVTALSFLPTAAARANRDFGKGIIIAIFMVFLSSMLVFATLLPLLGTKVFWDTVVIGYFKVAFVAAAANVVAGVLVCVRSAHDDVRRECAAILRGLGARISRLGTAAAGAAAGPAPAAADGWAAGRDVGREEGAVDRYLAGIRVYVDTRASECCATAGLEEASRQAAGSGAAAAEVGLPPPPAGASEAGLAPVWAALETSLKTSRLEPPLPQLCSQPGADPAKYGALEGQLARLQRAVLVLGRGQAGCLAALRASEGAAGATAARLRGALARVSGLAAAACAGAAEALAHMPALAKCSGAAVRWRPLPRAAWEEARGVLAAEGARLAESYVEGYQQGGLDFALSLGIAEHRALLYCLAAAAELLAAAAAAEAAAAAALDVPAEPPAAAPPAAGKEADGVVEKGGDVEAPAAAAAGSGAASGAPPPGLLRRLAANPYLANAAILLVLASPLPVAKITLDACLRMARAVPALLTSRQARRQVLRDPMVQYAFKYWLGMTSTVVIIAAIMWKVEASLFRGVLRTTMTVLGGTLGYLIMLNGDLANNPYWVCAWVAAFSWLAGLLAPDKSLRYALFLAVFTFNAVVLCQYVGCCSVAGDPKVYAGKVVSTVIGSTVALLLGWLVLPYYGSARMLADQAGVMQAALGLLRRMHVEVAAAAAEGRAVATGGWLETIESDMQAPLNAVAADLELNTLDHRQMPLTWHLLPDPPVLRLEQLALRALRDRLASAALALRQDLFTPGGHRLAGCEGEVVPGPVFRHVLPQLQPHVEHTMASLDTLVEACTGKLQRAANMTAGAAGSRLKPQRTAVVEAVGATQEARLQLHRAYLEAQPGALAAAGGHSQGDFACQAWLHAALRSTDKMMVAASLLLQDASQDRDVLGGWVRAWRGRRALPSS
ncbi:hypothetical protein CHLNCDRAFT_138922 [Chlorella variabilis]|uniref:Uncharacterized protein n=1 Tax=Chlorella variabilis TaxID=554065 RepID=E1ZNY2_CHLVA|nr:hypothetical protein CHLNCDRAFT_138922 [Chlorella variabilis]EFN52423.1 hypothetical protein CHLNCDRAFT_138922 [Chlorella variabilis]|eukprot:XP_005844525.1 hypothetical protein CHLNCDRAFT_138922 [Chlorella variabilis]